MNICVITSSYPRTPDDSAGGGVFVRDFAIELHKTQHNVFVFTYKKQGKEVYNDGFEVKSFNWLGNKSALTSLDHRTFFSMIKAVSLFKNGMSGLHKFVRLRNIDYCFAMWAIPSGFFTYSIYKRYKIPYSIWVLGSDIWSIDKYPFGRKLLTKILSNAQYLFADGFTLAEDTKKISGRECFFLPTSRKLPVNYSSVLLLDKTKTNFLFIGRFHRNKGVDILIDAFNLLVHQCKDIHPISNNWNGVHLNIFGGGLLQRFIENKTKQYNLQNFISLHGYASPETVVDYMRESDCLVIPSRIESIPVIFSDAMQMHIPVITTDVGDTSELVQKYGVGKVVPAENPQSLAHAMLEFISEKEHKLYTSNVEPLLKIFSAEESVNRFLEFIK